MASVGELQTVARTEWVGVAAIEDIARAADTTGELIGVQVAAAAKVDRRARCDDDPPAAQAQVGSRRREQPLVAGRQEEILGQVGRRAVGDAQPPRRHRGNAVAAEDDTGGCWNDATNQVVGHTGQRKRGRRAERQSPDGDANDTVLYNVRGLDRQVAARCVRHRGHGSGSAFDADRRGPADRGDQEGVSRSGRAAGALRVDLALQIACTGDRVKLRRADRQVAVDDQLPRQCSGASGQGLNPRNADFAARRQRDRGDRRIDIYRAHDIDRGSIDADGARATCDGAARRDGLRQARQADVGRNDRQPAARCQADAVELWIDDPDEWLRRNMETAS